MPTVSIVIPAYNAAKFISETLESVIAQTFDNWEVIVVIDGATDTTENIVASYASKNKQITYLTKPNSGVSDTRNIGINKAKGKYIAFLDADDIWAKDNLEKKIRVLERDNSISWVYSNMDAIDEQSNPLNLTPAKGTDHEILKSILLWEREVVPGPCSNIIVRRVDLGQNIRYDPKLSTAADQDFCLQLAGNNLKGTLIEEALWSYRILGNSMSRNVKVMETDHIKVYKKANQKGLFRSFWFKQKCFSNLYLTLAGSWWVNGQNKLRSIFFLLKSLLNYPPNISKILSRKLSSE